jgi:hypothetical protein
VRKHPCAVTLDSSRPIGWSAGHSSARNGSPSEKTRRRLARLSLGVRAEAPWLFNQLATVLKCQRTTVPSLHSTLEIRRSKFQEPFRFLRPAHSRAPVPRSPPQRASTSFRFRPPVPRIPHAGAAGSTKNQLNFSFPCAKASHKTAGPDYVTLHGLHDSKENRNHPRKRPLDPNPWSAPAERQRRRRFGRTSMPGLIPHCGRAQSGVALRLPPRSMPALSGPFRWWFAEPLPISGHI